MRYRKLLVSLSHAFELATDRTDLSALSPRGWLIHHCFAEMYNLRAIAGLLVRLPVSADEPDGARAGPTFPDALHPGSALDRGEPLAGAPGLAGRGRPAHRPAPRTRGPDSEGQAYLAAVAQLDQIERGQVELLIGAAPPVPSPVGGPMP